VSDRTPAHDAVGKIGGIANSALARASASVTGSWRAAPLERQLRLLDREIDSKDPAGRDAAPRAAPR
jgi:hypothetical protein